VLIQLVDSVAHSAHAASGHAGHAMGPWSLTAALFPYVAVGFLYGKRWILKRRYRQQAMVLAAEGRLAEPYP